MYVDFMTDYLSSRHMEPCESSVEFPNYYLPHHGVLKRNLTSSKLRVVFDASARTSSNVSLNDVLLSVPKLQNNIYDLILRSRLHSIVFTCDIRQMYRQIKVHPDDQRYQLILWRSEPSAPLLVYKLTTVTYGVTSSPFVAIRTLHQLAEDEGVNFPRAAEVLKSQAFVDDIITGADSIDDALLLKSELNHLLLRGGFELRKWCSNSSQLLSLVPEDHLDTPVTYNSSDEPLYNMLGLHWNSSEDYYSYLMNIPEGHPTKRFVLSTIASLYYPCGWLTPVILWAKYFIQLLWTLGLHWDDSLPSHMSQTWSMFLRDLPE